MSVYPSIEKFNDYLLNKSSDSSFLSLDFKGYRNKAKDLFREKELVIKYYDSIKSKITNLKFVPEDSHILMFYDLENVTYISKLRFDESRLINSIVEEIYNVLSTIDSENAPKYLANKNEYINSLNEVDTNINELVSNSSKKLLVFADRFPLLYFVKEYNLEYDAAFIGCESSKEASAITIEKLTKKVENNNLKVIFVIELSESNIANTIIKNCKKDGFNVEIKTFYTMHNVSKDDYEKGTSYVDFMKKNIEVLKTALR